MGFYSDDLAYIHHSGYERFAESAGAEILKMLQQRGILSGTAVDLGCGSGIWAQMCVAAGYQAFGVDYSAAMIALARERVPSGAFVQASFLDAELPPCVVVASMSECLNYLADPRNGYDTLQTLFQRIYAALIPGGLFLFDILDWRGFPKPVTRTHFREGEDWSVASQICVEPERSLLTRHIVSFRREGAHYRRQEETHRVRLYDSAALARLLREAGFRAQVRRAYGAFRVADTERVLMAVKPS
jgi:SAM-dependent methyltransferase